MYESTQPFKYNITLHFLCNYQKLYSEDNFYSNMELEKLFFKAIETMNKRKKRLDIITAISYKEFNNISLFEINFQCNTIFIFHKHFYDYFSEYVKNTNLQVKTYEPYNERINNQYGTVLDLFKLKMLSEFIIKVYIKEI